MAVKPPIAEQSRPASAVSGRMVVARFEDGRMIKGTTQDFAPNKPTFHIYENGDESATAVTVTIDELKAIFFVKSFEGARERNENYDFKKTQGHGRKALVMFDDAEVVAGFTMGYNRSRPGFFLIPADEESNNSRIYVVNKAVKSINWL